MSVSAETDVSSPFSDENAADRTFTKSSTDSLERQNDDVEAGQGNDKSEAATPTPHPMAFVINFGEGKSFDNRRLEELAKKSQARHQRVQSMSGVPKPSSPVQKPLSAKLPRKAQGYNSEGYFSSDQEDSGLSSSIKLKHSPQAQSQDKTYVTSPLTNRQFKSPIIDTFHIKRTSKSPIVDNIMSRSDNFANRQALNLPLKSSNNSFRDVHRTPSYGNLTSSYPLRHPMADIIDQSPEGVLLTDISTPELDASTPDNCLSTPEPVNSPVRKIRSETPDLLYNKCSVKNEPLYIDDDVDVHSNSSTGTYTIEKDTYTEEQKARMSIDRTFGAHLLNDAIDKSLKKRSGSNEKDPELIYDFPSLQRVITKEPRRDSGLRSPLTPTKNLDIPKVSKDKNVLEISCCYESPTENDLAVQTSKQIKSTRSYLEKIKNRVRTITEKTFSKSPPKHEPDMGSFTSVTTSGVLSSKYPFNIEIPRRRCSLTKSDIDQTDYVHRLSRESSVPVSLPSNKVLPFEETKFESSVLKNAQKAMIEDNVNIDMTEDQVVGKLSYLSLNRCKGDKTWIHEWAESVKNYNNNTLSAKDSDFPGDKPPLSPRHYQVKPRSPHGGTPTKIPSPVGTLLHRKTPDLIPTQETESYLQKTQNAITNLQAKLHSSKTNFSNIPSQLTTSVISEKTAISKLPVSQLSRSNSLNYRLRRKDSSGGSSPLRSPGNYVIIGSSKLPETTKLLLQSASKSLDTDRHDSNMNSPSSDRGVISNSSDDKTLSNKPQYDENVLHRKHHRKSPEYVDNANKNVILKTVLKNNAFEVKGYRIDLTRRQGDQRKSHQRVFSDGTNQPLRAVYTSNNIGYNSSIKRSSSFNTVSRNNNYIDPRLISRRSSGQSDKYDYLSDESDNGSFHKVQDIRYRPMNRGRLDSPGMKSIAPANSPRCPNTPEMQRKFGPGLVRNSVRVTKERTPNTRVDERKPVNHQSRKVSEPTRQNNINRLTKSRSSTREAPVKNHDKGSKKPSQHRSSSALASKEIEFSNWKKRSSYDPMKAAQEGKRRQIAKRQECKEELLSSPSHSSPVHRSQSFHTTNILDLEVLDYSSEETEDDQVLTLPVDPMITSTHSDILDLRSKGLDLRRQAMNNDVVLARDYVTHFQVNKPTEKIKRRHEDKRKTYILDDITPTKENIDFLRQDTAIDKRKTFILDSDTNSTTNGSSPRNSSIFSHEKNSLTTCTSDTEGESGTESAPVVMRQGKKPIQPKQRYSGDFSMSSSTTSINKRKDVQPKYLDISKYKNETKNFLRKDPSKTYVGVLADRTVSRGSAQQYEMEQKKQELEKWKRRASYDPRKAAASAKKSPPKTASIVLRSQSFHGPVLASARLAAAPAFIAETYDASSDNDF